MKDEEQKKINWRRAKIFHSVRLSFDFVQVDVLLICTNIL